MYTHQQRRSGTKKKFQFSIVHIIQKVQAVPTMSSEQFPIYNLAPMASDISQDRAIAREMHRVINE